MIANLDGLNKAFESKIRLGIMSVLMANESVDFTTMKSLLELTDGNLASHARSLEELGYIRCEKCFIGSIANNNRLYFFCYINFEIQSTLKDKRTIKT